MRLVILALGVALALAACASNPNAPKEPAGPPPGSVWLHAPVNIYPPSLLPCEPAGEPVPRMPSVPPQPSKPCASEKPPDCAAMPAAPRFDRLGDPMPVAFGPSSGTRSLAAPAGPDSLRSGPQVAAMDVLPAAGALGLLVLFAVWAILKRRGRHLRLIPLILFAVVLAGCSRDWTLATMGDVDRVEQKFDGAFEDMDERAVEAVLAGKDPGQAALDGISAGRTHTEENPANEGGGNLTALWIVLGGLLGVGGYRWKTGRYPLFTGLVEILSGRGADEAQETPPATKTS